MPLAPRKYSERMALSPQDGTNTTVDNTKAASAAADAVAYPASAAAPATAPSTLASAPAAGSKPKIKPLRAGFGQELTAYDLKIQRQIQRAGVWQAAVQCQAIVQYAPDFEAYKKLVRELANDGVIYTEE